MSCQISIFNHSDGVMQKLRYRNRKNRIFACRLAVEFWDSDRVWAVSAKPNISFATILTLAARWTAQHGDKEQIKKNNKMLERIEIKQKTGNEPLLFNKKETGVKLIDFWRWGFSDIISNTARGRFAEFIVATALKIDLSIIYDEWNAYDLTSPEGIKVEVKSSAYLQTWEQKDFSKISFSIRAARCWNSITNEMAETPSRESDVYVFCLLKHKDQATLNPLNLEQWDFLVLSTLEINNYQRSNSSITLNSLLKLTERISYNNLRNVIIREYEKNKK